MDKKIRAVCVTCNNGWMSQIEETSKSVLTPLILGLRATIDQTSADEITRWVTLKMFVAEALRKKFPITSQIERIEFYMQRTIPDHFEIWIGRCGIGHWQTNYAIWSTHIAPRHYPRPLLNAPHNVQHSTFGIGNLLVVSLLKVREAREVKTTVNHALYGPMFQLKPFQHAVTWPPLETVTTEYADILSRSLVAAARAAERANS